MPIVIPSLSWRSVTGRVRASSGSELNSTTPPVAKAGAEAAVADKVKGAVAGSDQPSEPSVTTSGTPLHVSAWLLCDPACRLQLCR